MQTRTIEVWATGVNGDKIVGSPKFLGKADAKDIAEAFKIVARSRNDITMFNGAKLLYDGQQVTMCQFRAFKIFDLHQRGLGRHVNVITDDEYKQLLAFEGFNNSSSRSSYIDRRRALTSSGLTVVNS